MRGKVLFVVGLGVGYVLGTRAGRRRYEQIKAAAQNIWESEPVQWGVHQVQDYAGDVAGNVLDGAKKVFTTVAADVKKANQPARSHTTAAKKPAAKTTASKPAAKTSPSPSPAAARSPRTEPAARTRTNPASAS